MIVGITGLAGSGKSTVARRLMLVHAFERLPFALALKNMLRVVGFTEEQLEGDEKEMIIPRVGKSPRQIMQLLGTEFGREAVHPDFWVALWDQRVAWAEVAVGRIVVDDIRFPNEVAAVRARGGVVYRVERPGIEQMAHKSEGQALDVDGVIKNIGSIDDLHAAADEIAVISGATRGCV